MVAISPSLNGPYRLSYDDIRGVVRRRQAGAYALGYLGPRGEFYVRSVGRADKDLAQRLCDLIGSDQAFKFLYTPTEAAAFVSECSLFHSFKPQGTPLHPERPKGSNLVCPFCAARAPQRRPI